MGKVIMSGRVPKLVVPEVPVKGILASELAVGSSVFLNENGSPVEYLAVNQGIPSDSSLYDSSCDGLWLLRKDVYTNRAWDSTDNDYPNSDIHTYLNDTFMGLFDTDTQNAIQLVKLPCAKGSASTPTVYSGDNGLSTKVFLLAQLEVWGNSANSTYDAVDGACLDYFKGDSGTDRIAYMDGTATGWTLRTPLAQSTANVRLITTSGYLQSAGVAVAWGIRPALILPSNVLFDEETLIFKGVS